MIAAMKAAGRDKEKRRAAMAPINRDFTACLKQRHDALIAEFVTRRGSE